MELTRQVTESLGYYLNALTQFGYRKQDDVNRLLVYNFIEEMLTGEMRYYITEEDYRIIEQALSCLYGSSCLIPYPRHTDESSLFGYIENAGLIIPRITEDYNIRFTEDDIIRLKASDYNE